MEGRTARDTLLHNSGHTFKGTDSQETFQQFLYELFEKNGILSNLRAHLRSHIVEVLRSAQSGNPLPTQKKFTQRLELPFQALNILIVEHLIVMEFNYTLSVFISEIPLANMVFDFAKSLFEGLDSSESHKHLRFKENDVWSILNCLGVKCSSDFAINILEMYKQEEQSSLLLCILKYMPVYYADVFEDGLSSALSSQSSIRIYGSETREIPRHRRPSPYKGHNCKHLISCKDCMKKIQKLKKKNLEKNEKIGSTMSMDCFMRSVGVAERHIMEEMFDQIKTVYEAEVDMYKAEEEKRLKKSLVNHAKLLKQRRDEMEARFKEREAELFHNVNQKKKFLWGLATTLREQHASMAQAMADVKRHTELLAEKEDNLRAQLLEAEESLKTRGEEMRAEISNELQTLEQHLESLKLEREKINQERIQLEQLKSVCENADKIASQHNLETNNSSNFEMLKNEISILKQYLENTKGPKCLIETGTLTEPLSESVLNNEQCDRNSDEKDSKCEARTLNQVVNDLKKQKNVNFCQENVELYREYLACNSSASEVVDRLKQENEYLKSVARQQRQQLDILTRQQNQLPTRPRSSPLVQPSVRSHCGAGEELNTLCVGVQRRVYTPDDAVPFVSNDTLGDTRRYLISQWRKLRRMSPPSPRKHKSRIVNKPSTSHEKPVLLERSRDSEDQVEEEPPSIKKSNTVPRQKSPNSILREAKEKLRNKDRIRLDPSTSRRSSPSAVLREAKQRLRKLELQAEAVENSYMQYRRNCDVTNPSTSREKLDDKAYQRISDAYVHSENAMKCLKLDYDRYLSQTEENLEETYFNKQTGLQINTPITSHFKPTVDSINVPEKENYVDIPMSEFRKFYSGFSDITIERDTPERDIPNVTPKKETEHEITETIDNKTAENEKQENICDSEIAEDNIERNDLIEERNLESNDTSKENLREKTELGNIKTSLSDKKIELDILKKDINILCNNSAKYENDKVDQDVSLKSEAENRSMYSEVSKDSHNLLRVELNSISEAEKSIKSAKLVVVVKSSLNQGDKGENDNVTVVSPRRNNEIDRSQTYNLSDKDQMSIGGVNQDILATGEGNISAADNYLDDFTIPSDATPPISEEENFWGN